eukprot:IDg4996t1
MSPPSIATAGKIPVTNSTYDPLLQIYLFSFLSIYSASRQRNIEGARKPDSEYGNGEAALCAHVDMVSWTKERLLARELQQNGGCIDICSRCCTCNAHSLAILRLWTAIVRSIDRMGWCECDRKRRISDLCRICARDDYCVRCIATVSEFGKPMGTPCVVLECFTKKTIVPLERFPLTG